MYRLDLEKAEESDIKLPAFTRSCRKQRTKEPTEPLDESERGE